MAGSRAPRPGASAGRKPRKGLPAPPPPPKTVAERFTFLGRRRGTIALCGILAGAGAVGVSYLQTPAYEATASLVFRPPAAVSVEEAGGSGEASDGQGEAGPGERFVRTQLKVLLSQPVREKAVAALGTDVGVMASVVPGADAIEVTGRASDPEGAATVANAYVNAFVEYRRSLAVDEILASRDRVAAEVAALETQLAATAPDARGPIVAQLDPLRVRAADLENQAAGVRDPDVIEAAEVPTTPTSPQPIRSGALAMAAGMLLGVLVAAVAEALDRSIKSRADFQRTLPGVAVLGCVPAIGQWRTKEDALTITLADPRSPAAESYRTLRTTLSHGRELLPFRSLQVTSAATGEGKTTTAANLAVVFASAGLKVVLVGCDLRRPRIHEFFDLSNDVGFTSVLLGKVPLSRAIQEVPLAPRLFVLAGGPVPPNPSELLSSRRTAEVLNSLAADSDLLIIDSPPLLPVTDGLILAEAVDATLLVAVVTSTTQGELRRAMDLAASVDALVLGAVLNGASPEDAYTDDDFSLGYEAPAPQATPFVGGQPSAAFSPPGAVLAPGPRTAAGGRGQPGWPTSGREPVTRNPSGRR
ncbi:MAG: polysaccharide biosynthesis tyrosine autokinase [Acidimicrobiales bacterium]